MTTTTKVGTPIDHTNLNKYAETLPNTPAEAVALFNKGAKVLGTPKKAKKIGVVGISKAENEQLGLLVRWIALELDWDTIPNEVLVNPEALTKLIGRYQVKS